MWIGLLSLSKCWMLSARRLGTKRCRRVYPPRDTPRSVLANRVEPSLHQPKMRTPAEHGQLLKNETQSPIVALPKSLQCNARAVSSAVRASGLHPEGPAFKSLTAHHASQESRSCFLPLHAL